MMSIGLGELAVMALICAFILAPLVGVSVLMLVRRRKTDERER